MSCCARSFRFDRACLKLVEQRHDACDCFLPHKQPLSTARYCFRAIQGTHKPCPIVQSTHLHIRGPVEQSCIYARASAAHSRTECICCVVVLFTFLHDKRQRPRSPDAVWKPASCNTHRLLSPQRLFENSVGDIRDIHGLEKLIIAMILNLS